MSAPKFLIRTALRGIPKLGRRSFSSGVRVDSSVAKSAFTNPARNAEKVDNKPEKTAEKCGPDVAGSVEEDDLNEWEEMFVMGPAGVEWNGPTRGGQRPEPTRFGDWERKGRASDF